MCDQNPLRQSKMRQEKEVLALCFCPYSLIIALLFFSCFLPFLCGIRLATLASALSPDSSLGSDKHRVENARSCLKFKPGTELYQMPGMAQMSRKGSKTSKCCLTSALEIASFIHLPTVYTIQNNWN